MNPPLIPTKILEVQDEKEIGNADFLSVLIVGPYGGMRRQPRVGGHAEQVSDEADHTDCSV
jgi:hypothetical protein